MTERERLLEEAREAVMGRGAAYGEPEDSFANITTLWNDYLRGTDEDPPYRELALEDVAIMLMLLKVARLMRSPMHRDSVVDIAGYAACLAEIQQDRTVGS